MKRFTGFDPALRPERNFMNPSHAAWLVAASAATVFALGLLHLVLTFHGRRFHARDATGQAGMQQTTPFITRDTTMWKAWIGFNASHSYGAMLFGLVWGYLALWQPGVLTQSRFLQGLGLALLAAYVHLGWRYWFSVPFRGILLALLLYGAALVLLWG
jgi:hypothetical protein